MKKIEVPFSILLSEEGLAVLALWLWSSWPHSFPLVVERQVASCFLNSIGSSRQDFPPPPQGSVLEVCFIWGIMKTYRTKMAPETSYLTTVSPSPDLLQVMYRMQVWGFTVFVALSAFTGGFKEAKNSASLVPSHF